MAFFEILSGLGNIASAGASVASLFKDQSFDPYQNPALIRQMQSARMSELFAKWTANPNSKAFKNLEAVEREKIQQDLIGTIRDRMRMERVSQARGDPSSLVNPERRDESRFRALLGEYERSKIQARDMARQYLLTASQGQAAASGAFAGPAGTIGEANVMNYRTGLDQQAAQIDALGSLPRALEDFIKIFQGGGGPSRGGFGAAMGARSGGGAGGQVYNVNPYYRR